MHRSREHLPFQRFRVSTSDHLKDSVQAENLQLAHSCSRAAESWWLVVYPAQREMCNNTQDRSHLLRAWMSTRRHKIMSTVTFTQANNLVKKQGVGPGRVLDLLKASLGNFRRVLPCALKACLNFPIFSRSQCKSNFLILAE